MVKQLLVGLLVLSAALPAVAEDKAVPDHANPSWWLNACGRDAAFIVGMGLETDDYNGAKIDYLTFAAAGLALLGETEQAKAYLEHAIKTQPTLEDAYYQDSGLWGIAFAQAWAGDFEAAEQTASRIESIDTRLLAMTDVAVAHRWRGEPEKYAAKIDKALQAVAAAEKANTDPDTDFQWGYALTVEYQLDAGDIDGARKTIEKYITDDLAKAEAYGVLAGELAMTGKADQAAKAIGKAQAALAKAARNADEDEWYDDSIARKHLAAALALTGQYDQALELVDAQREVEMAGETMGAIAAGYAFNGKAQDARVMLDEAWRLSSNYEEALSRAWGYETICWYAAEAGLAEHLVDRVSELATPIERAAARSGAGMGLIERARRQREAKGE